MTEEQENKKKPFDKKEAQEHGLALINILEQSPQNLKTGVFKKNINNLNDIFKIYLEKIEHQAKKEVFYTPAGELQDFVNVFKKSLNLEHFYNYYLYDQKSDNKLIFNWHDFWNWADFTKNYSTPILDNINKKIGTFIENSHNIDLHFYDGKSDLYHLMNFLRELEQVKNSREDRRFYSTELKIILENSLNKNIINHLKGDKDYINCIIRDVILNDFWDLSLNLIKKHQTYPSNINEIILDGFHQGSAQHYGVHNQEPNVAHPLVDYLIGENHLQDLSTQKQDFRNYYYSYYYKTLYDHPCFCSPLMKDLLVDQLLNQEITLNKIFTLSHVKINFIKDIVHALMNKDIDLKESMAQIDTAINALKHIGGGPEDLSEKKEFLAHLKVSLESRIINASTEITSKSNIIFKL